MTDREILNIDKFVLACIMEWSQEDEATEEQIEESSKYEFIQNTITGVDEHDGGSDNTAIIKRIEDGKYFKLEYQEWDVNWEYGHFDDYEPELFQVFPKEVKTIIYE